MKRKENWKENMWWGPYKIFSLQKREIIGWKNFECCVIKYFDYLNLKKLNIYIGPYIYVRINM